MKLLLFTLFVASVSAGSFKVGNVKCTFGPSYWCQNYKQAKECNAIQHCQDRVWKASSNETCAACQAALNEVKTLLAQPEIDKMILGYLEQACAEFGSLAAECKALVEQYEPLVLKELQQLLANPKQLCIEFGLCSASREKIMAVLLQKALPVKLKSFAGFNLKKHILKAINPVKASAECILCEFIASELDDLLGKNATQQEIKDALDKVCSFLPSTIGTECKSFVDEYAAEILQILSQELNPKIICTTLNLCSSKGHVQVTKKRSGNGEVCEVCTLVMTYVKNLLQDNTTDDEIVKALEQFCSDLPAQIASECKAIVSEYGMEVLKLIASSDPNTLCTEIGLCTSKLKLHKVLKDKCFLGASYWCANRDNAVKCNATAFCKKHAW